MTTCDRCGQLIAKTFYFDGQVYGSECIEVVTGRRKDSFVWNGNAVNLAATAERDARREARRLALAEETARLEREHEERRKRYSVENAEVIAILRGSYGDFASDMATTLESQPLSSLSHRQFLIVCDIVGKAFGRGNSKAYWAAYEKVSDLAELQEAAK